MTAVISFPSNDGGLPLAIIYRADSATDIFTLIDTVSARQVEYEDKNGDYSKIYKVAFSDGTTERTGEIVKSVSQHVLDVIRNELKITETEFLSNEVDFFIQQAKIDVQMDICKFYYGVQLTKLEDTVYKLPNKFFYDLNCGGVVSILDFVFFKQTIPLVAYSPKVPVIPIYADPDQQYVILSEPLASNEILKMNYFTIDRRLDPAALWRLLAYRVCCMHYTNEDFAKSNQNISKVTIGDITVQNSSTTSTSSTVQDAVNKIENKYKRFISNFKSEFVRVH